MVVGYQHGDPACTRQRAQERTQVIRIVRARIDYRRHFAPDDVRTGAVEGERPRGWLP